VYPIEQEKAIMKTQIQAMLNDSGTLFHFTSSPLAGADDRAWFPIEATVANLREAIQLSVRNILSISGLTKEIFAVDCDFAAQTITVTYEPSCVEASTLADNILEVMKRRIDVISGQPVTFYFKEGKGVCWTPEIISEQRETIIYVAQSFGFLLEEEETDSAIYAQRIREYSCHPRSQLGANLIESLSAPLLAQNFC
jgi:hypothetical protein